MPLTKPGPRRGRNGHNCVGTPQITPVGMSRPPGDREVAVNGRQPAASLLSGGQPENCTHRYGKQGGIMTPASNRYSVHGTIMGRFCGFLLSCEGLTLPPWK
jgi:hypothetical protein